VYNALFTCATTRGLHFKIVPNLSCKAILLCFKRFVSHRGQPKLVVTHNGKTFKADLKKIRNIVNPATVNHYLVKKNVKWKSTLQMPYGGEVSMSV